MKNKTPKVKQTEAERRALEKFLIQCEKTKGIGAELLRVFKNIFPTPFDNGSS